MQNKVADGLSRLPIMEEEKKMLFVSQVYYNVLNREVVARETHKDEMLEQAWEFVTNGWPEKKLRTVPVPLQPYYIKRFSITIEGGFLLYDHRVIIPSTLRQACLQELHRNHFGVTKMKSLARSYFYWPSMDKEIEQLTNSCQLCLQARKIHLPFVCTSGSTQQSPVNAFMEILVN